MEKKTWSMRIHIVRCTQTQHNNKGEHGATYHTTYESVLMLVVMNCLFMLFLQLRDIAVSN